MQTLHHWNELIRDEKLVRKIANCRANINDTNTNNLLAFIIDKQTSSSRRIDNGVDGVVQLCKQQKVHCLLG